jgi:hypothetical protein
MDCETCTDKLIDLLYDDVEESEAVRLRGHIDGCEACHGAWSRLRAGYAFAQRLPLAEAPRGVEATVMAAAQQRSASRPSLEAVEAAEPAAEVEARTPVASREPPPEDEGLLPGLLRWLGGLAMGPQVAMAMLLLLMVGLGLWGVPELRRHDPTATGPIVDPSPRDEVGPVAPPPNELPAATPGQARGGEAVADTPTPAPVVAALPRATLEEVAPAEEQREASEEPPADTAPEEYRESAEEGSAVEPDVALALGSPEAEALADGEGAIPEAAPGLAMEEARSAPAALPAAPAPRAAGVRRRAAGMDDALEGPGPDDEALTAAIHRMARSLAERNRCAEALGQYARVLADATYGQRGHALLEAGRCEERLGRLDAAERRYEAARAYAPLRSLADRALAQLRARRTVDPIDMLEMDDLPASEAAQK